MEADEIATNWQMTRAPRARFTMRSSPAFLIGATIGLGILALIVAA
jgi:hypothetical protein